MANVSVSPNLSVPFVPAQQIDHPPVIDDLIAINQHGTGKVTSIDRRGLSFGCLYRHQFPQEWSLDIIDANGTHIKQLRVKKLWEEAHSTGNFAVEIGVEFANISTKQQREVDCLLT